MIIMIWCYLSVAVVVGKWGMSDALPSYEVLIHVIKNDEVGFGNEMSSVVRREVP